MTAPMTITQLANKLNQAPIQICIQVTEEIRYIFKFYRCGHVDYLEASGNIHDGFVIDQAWTRVSRKEFLTVAIDAPFMMEAVEKFEAERERLIIQRFKSFGWEVPAYTK